MFTKYLMCFIMTCFYHLYTDNSYTNAVRLIWALFISFKAEETQGPVDVLINCAGTSMSAKFLDTPLIEFRVRF